MSAKASNVLSYAQLDLLLQMKKEDNFFYELAQYERQLINGTIQTLEYNFMIQGFLNDIRDKWAAYKRNESDKIHDV